MSAVRNVLVIGAGSAGTAAAILLAEAGISVDLVEAKPDIAALGSGITLQGNALRVLRQLGIWDEVRAKGYAYDTLGLRAPDAAGTLLVELDELRSGGPDLPANMGMFRPDLARILVDRAVAAGTKIRFGSAPTGLVADEQGVTIDFSDGSTGRYDLVVGADGIHSWTRRTLGIDIEPRPTGMGIWRLFAPRPASITRTDLYYGGSAYIAGYCPTGPDTLYAYLVEDARDDARPTPEQGLAAMLELASAYHGPWDEVRALMTDPDRINYAKFESHVIDGPWHRGRVVLIGDAAHSCPPTLAQGCAQALEDAAVLAELLIAHDAVSEDLWREFTGRRLPRAKDVVESSVRLGQWLLDGEQGDVAGLMTRLSLMVAEPA